MSYHFSDDFEFDSRHPVSLESIREAICKVLDKLELYDTPEGLGRDERRIISQIKSKLGECSELLEYL